MENVKSTWAMRQKKNTIRLAVWTAGWTLSLALATFGPMFLWQGNSTITILAIILNLIFGIGMIFTNKHHLKGLDEMLQKIELEAMAVALGVGVVGGLSYSVMDITNLISTDAEISHLVILIGLTYMAGTIIGRIRYK